VRHVRFQNGGDPREGVLDGDTIRPAGDGAPVALADVRLLAPVVAGKVIAVGQNYMDHIREQGAKPPGIPVLFPKFATCVIGPGDEIRWPATLTTRVDYEGELAVVIGTRASRVPVEEALGVVRGYTVANDVSARDLQIGDGQWLRGKALDTFLPLGPAIVTADEVGDPQDLPIRTRVKGETLQNSSTGEMVFTVAELIAFITEGITLEPGDVVLTGTPHGVDNFRDPQVFLSPGDVVEVEVGGPGVLSNVVGPHTDDEEE
jgi:2-keto-4-pentenoate hydratase/2-oxohepta-3-ene-1,7-dioic acid hydratase in catechol pathway